MRKLMICLTSLSCLMAGSCLKPEPVVEKALFCDVEEPRRFTQEEINWRAVHAPWNLRRDYKTNLTHERECPASP